MTNTMCNSNGIQVEPAHIGRLCLPQQLTAKLIRAGILTIEDLVGTTECDLLHLRGVGRKSITQIKRAFEPLGQQCQNEGPPFVFGSRTNSRWALLRSTRCLLLDEGFDSL